MVVIFFKMIGCILLLLLFIISLIALIKGQGTPVRLSKESKNTFDKQFSTREKIYINNSEQYVFITSEDITNPVLLFLHGGPGSPEVAMHNFKDEDRLEKRFTVCYWEQRGAGLSYQARLSPEEMTLDLMVEDTLQVTEYLMKRFHKEQIYLMGHSWGSFLSIKTIQKKTDYYKAYLGVGQLSDQKESERLAYDFMLNHATLIKDKKAIKALTAYDLNTNSFPSNKYIMSTRTKYMNKYGIGVKHEDNFKMTVLLKEVFLFSGYSLIDCVKFGLGSSFSMNLNSIYLNENLMETSTHLNVPIYILHGIYDYQVSHELAKEYLETIQAPDKGFYSFNQSAHSPNFEETKKFLTIVFSLLDKQENSRLTKKVP